MPLCRVGQQAPFVVDSADDCKAAGGTIVTVPDAGTGSQPDNGVCFVRNGLTRALSGVMLDIGAANAIQASMIEYLEIPPKAAAKKKPGKSAFVELTAARRRDLSARVAATIIRLGATYPTMLDFVTELMHTTARGRELMIEYDRYLDEAYRAAYSNTRLLFDSTVAWFEIYPFVAGMVAAATTADGARAKHGPKFSARSRRKLAGLLERYHEASDDRGFRDLLGRLETEFAGYEGLSAKEAVTKLRESPARG